MIDQARNIVSPAPEPEIGDASAVMQANVGAALARASEKLALRSELEGFCRRPVDVATLEFLIENGRLLRDEAYGLYDQVESLRVQLTDAAQIMGMLTPQEADELLAAHPADEDERLICAVRVDEPVREPESFDLPEWVDDASVGLLTLDALEREELSVLAGPTVTEHGQMPALPFFGGWWAANPSELILVDQVDDPEEES